MMDRSSFAGMVDCYFLLGVQPAATREEIEAAYAKELASFSAGGFFHRLKCFWFGKSPENIRGSYLTLVDPVSRQKYDEWRRKYIFDFWFPF